MIAYNKTSLDNALLQEEAAQAYRQQCITQEERSHIKAAYPVDFYTPNVYIRAGLFALTAFIVMLSLWLVILVFGAGVSYAWKPVFTVFGLAVYGALELLVKGKKHYRSGVDDGLLWTSALLLTIVLFDTGLPTWLLYLFASAIALYATLRFADCMMTAAAIVTLLSGILYACVPLGKAAHLIAPLLIMAVSFVLYQLARRLGNNEKWRHYAYCCVFGEITTLITGYLAVNYLAAAEVYNDIYLQQVRTPAVDWFLWLCTLLIPLIYVYQGIRKKDAILLRIGLLAIAAAIYTVHYYYSVMPAETLMTLSGILLLAAAYFIMRYLRTPRHGFTSLPDNNTSTDLLERIPAASLILSETQPPSSATHPAPGIKFGGGSGGGGGADGSW